MDQRPLKCQVYLVLKYLVTNSLPAPSMAWFLMVSKPLPSFSGFLRPWAHEGHTARHHSPQLVAEGASGAGVCTPLRPPGCVRISSGSQHDGSGHPIVYKKSTEGEEEFKEVLQK